MSEIHVQHTDRGTVGRDAVATGAPVLSRINWGAVIAGLVITLALQLVLGLLRAAIGLSTFDTGDSARKFDVGAAIWALPSPLVALFVGGTTTGRVAGVISRTDEFLHGALLWSLATLMAVCLLSRGVGAVAGRAFSLAGNVTGSRRRVPPPRRRSRGAHAASRPHSLRFARAVAACRRPPARLRASQLGGSRGSHPSISTPRP